METVKVWGRLVNGPFDGWVGHVEVRPDGEPPPIVTMSYGKKLHGPGGWSMLCYEYELYGFHGESYLYCYRRWIMRK